MSILAADTLPLDAAIMSTYKIIIIIITRNAGLYLVSVMESIVKLNTYQYCQPYDDDNNNNNNINPNCMSYTDWYT